MCRGRAVTVAAFVIAACGGGNDGVDDARPVSDAAPPPADAAPVDGSTSGLPETPPEPLPTGDPAVTVVSFNTALAATIWYAEERKPFIVEKLEALAADADVVCLQEVWDSYAPNQTSGPKELAELVKTEWPYAFWDYTKEFVWGNGLLILSKHPLYRGRSKWFEANDDLEICDRMVLGVDVLMEDSSYFHVMCTHLQAQEGDVNIAIREAEIAEVRSWAEEQGYYDGPTFFLGDMNCGVQTAPCTGVTCTEVDADNYQRLLEDWNDPNEADGGVPNVAGQCTYCVETARPLQRLDECASGGIADCDPDVRLDHCFYHAIGTSELAEASIVLDDIVEVTPEVGPDWDACDGGVPCGEFCGGDDPCEPRESQISDHKGVRCRFAPPD